MMNTVSSEEKVKFLRWFIKNHPLKTVEATSLLNYLAYTPGIVDNVRFVSDATLYDLSVFISSVDMKETGFLYKKDSSVYTSAMPSFGDIKMNPNAILHVQCNFPFAYQSEEYFCVLEEKPDTLSISPSEKSEVTDFCAIMVYTSAEQILQDKINFALDSKDQELFKKTMVELEKLHDSTIFQTVKKSTSI